MKGFWESLVSVPNICILHLAELVKFSESSQIEDSVFIVLLWGISDTIVATRVQIHIGASLKDFVLSPSS